MGKPRVTRLYEELPCGCVIGSFLCPEAERLWAEVGAAYHAAMRGAGTWEQYQEARTAYSRHFWEQGVFSESDLMDERTPAFRAFLEERYGLTLTIWSGRAWRDRAAVVRAYRRKYGCKPDVWAYNPYWGVWYLGFIPLSQEVGHGNDSGSQDQR